MDSPLKQIENQERNQSFTGIVVGIFFLVISVIIIWFSVLKSKSAQQEPYSAGTNRESAPASTQDY